MNWEGFGRKGSWPNLVGGTEGDHEKPSVRMASVLAEIRNERSPNAGRETVYEILYLGVMLRFLQLLNICASSVQPCIIIISIYSSLAACSELEDSF
jgi:hypothetical protein